MVELQDKVAVVTGASSGIGAHSRTLANQGVKAVLNRTMSRASRSG